MYFCVKCGKKVEKGVFCSEHTPVSEDYKSIKLSYCECGRGFSNNRWTNQESVDSFLKKVLRKQGIVGIPVLTDTTTKLYKYSVGTDEFIVKKEKCNLCEKQHSQYFEGVLQLRFDGILKNRVLKSLDKQRKDWIKKHVYIIKENTTKEGMDLWITNKRELSMFSDKLVRQFGATVIKSAKLFSRNKQTQKNIYRLNVTVYFPKFEEGAVVLVNEKLAKVLQLRRQIKALNIKSGKTFGFFLKNDPVILKTKKTVVSKIKPEISILDPDNYEEVSIANSHLIKNVNPGKKVSVVKNNNLFYIIP